MLTQQLRGSTPEVHYHDRRSSSELRIHASNDHD